MPDLDLALDEGKSELSHIISDGSAVTSPALAEALIQYHQSDSSATHTAAEGAGSNLVEILAAMTKKVQSVLGLQGFPIRPSTVDFRHLLPLLSTATCQRSWKKMCRPMLCNIVPIAGCLS